VRICGRGFLVEAGIIRWMPAQANQPLPEGYQLLNYRLLRVLSSGGFSIVYLAHDENDVPMAIKEYLPAQLALRVGDQIAPNIAEENLATFRYGMRCFFDEGRALARLSHPNVVRVLNFFRANETVYLVMRYERGRTLQEHVHVRSGALPESWVRRTFAQLLSGLREVHTNKMLHLDIKPGNIYIRNDGTPLLIDFGAARQTLTEEGTKLPPMYTPGYASPEHHTRREHLGPWSDIYSVGASMYACMALEPPQPADRRLERDRLVPARKAWAGKYSEELLTIIDWCLRLDHLERPQSVFELQQTLRGLKEPVLRQRRWPILRRLIGAVADLRKPRA
jgi:serine/threonine protein kinase